MTPQKNEIVVYQPNDIMRIEVRFEDETVWRQQPRIAELFACSLENVRLHLINPESGRIKNVRSYDIKSQDDAVLCAIQDCPGIKADGIFLQIRTSTRSVRCSLERLSGASKIEYRGSKRTGGWYVRT